MTKTPEQEARETIDKMLDWSGWDVQDLKTANIRANKGIAIREFPLKSGHGYADYLLYVDGQAAGVIEAKKVGTTLTGVEIQSEKYKTGLPEDLPAWYRPLPFCGVTTKALNQAVTRNEQRFPPDFMFRLAKEEKQELVTNCDRLDRLKHSSALPHIFTEQGVAMLSSVLRSERAIHVNIQIMRVFTRLRQLVLDNEELRKELEELKQITDERFQIVFETLDQLLNIENKPKKIYLVQFATATI